MRKLSTVASAALYVIVVFSLSSCFSSWQIEGSADLSSEHETGPSGESGFYAPNFNFVMEALDILSDGFLIYDDRANFDDYPGPWSPERYVAANKPENSFGLVTTGGYIGKGQKDGGATEHLNYLELSEAFAYLHKTSGGLLYGGLGPYVAYGIGGKVTYNGGSESLFGGSDGYKRFDAGLHFLAGYRFKMGLSVEVGYDLGLYDKSNDPSDYTSTNRTMMVEVGYSVEKILGAFKRK
jgi:Outer membrane protein beta-barrel domain